MFNVVFFSFRLVSSGSKVQYYNKQQKQWQKYAPEDSGAAEMCHLFCSKSGRGHLHTMLCKNGKNILLCTEKTNGKMVQRHCIDHTKYHGLDSNTAVDELLHEEYWKKVGFEDPYKHNRPMLNLFSKCNARCSHPSHKQEKSYCVLDVWHDDVKDDSTKEYTIADGHQFSCKHALEPHVYVLHGVCIIFANVLILFFLFCIFLASS